MEGSGREALLDRTTLSLFLLCGRLSASNAKQQWLQNKISKRNTNFLMARPFAYLFKLCLVICSQQVGISGYYIWFIGLAVWVDIYLSTSA
jgi:hypothetical protein